MRCIFTSQNKFTYCTGIVHRLKMKEILPHEEIDWITLLRQGDEKTESQDTVDRQGIMIIQNEGILQML
jgi:hypothetical protein